jgi:hypothetical protein
LTVGLKRRFQAISERVNLRADVSPVAKDFGESGKRSVFGSERRKNTADPNADLIFTYEPAVIISSTIRARCLKFVG